MNVLVLSMFVGLGATALVLSFAHVGWEVWNPHQFQGGGLQGPEARRPSRRPAACCRGALESQQSTQGGLRGVGGAGLG